MTDRRWMSRKFALAAAGFVAGVAFFGFGFMTADQWISWNTWLLGLYTAGNIGDTAASK